MRLHLAGEHASRSLNVLIKWLGERNPDFSEMSCIVSSGAFSSSLFACSILSPVIHSRNDSL